MVKKMKRVLLSAVLLLMPLMLNAEGRKNAIIIGKTNVAESVDVASKRRGTSLDLEKFTDALNTEFISAINSFSVFQIVERDRKEDLELEQAYADIAVGGGEKAKMFQMRGAKYILLPEIDSFEVTESRTNYHAIARTTVNRSISSSVTLKIVDTTTGEVLPISPSLQKSTASAATLARLGTSVASDNSILSLAKLMANELVKQVIDGLYPPKVLLVKDNEVMINKGKSSGFITGRGVDFYQTSDVEDEDSGEIFKDEVLVGSGIVVRADEKKCYVKVNSGKEKISKGNVAKLKPFQQPARKKIAKQPVQDVVPVGSSEKPLNM